MSLFVNLDQFSIKPLGLLALEILNSFFVSEQVVIYLHMIFRKIFQKIFLCELFAAVKDLRED
jgi:hypothetical protein